VADLPVALAATVHELPHLVEDLRGLVRQLERAAQPDGELMRLLDGLARLAEARAEREHVEADELRNDWHELVANRPERAPTNGHH
jgi:hypothetical protein